MFRSFVVLYIIRNDVQLHSNTRDDYKMFTGINKVYGDNVETIAIF
jgi:hypothetical protein